MRSSASVGVVLDFLQPRRDGRLGELVLVVLRLGQQSFLAAVFLVHFLHLLRDGGDLGFQFLDGGLLGGEVAGDEQRGRDQVGLDTSCLPTVKSGFSFVFLSLSSMMSRGLAASRQPSLTIM